MRSAAIARAGYSGHLVRALTAGVLALAAVALAGCGGSKQREPKLLVGAVEDAAKFARDPGAQMKLARDSGFRAVVLSAVWEDGASAAADAEPLRRAVEAAGDEDIRPVLAIYQFSASTPADPGRRDAFVAYATALTKALPEVRDVIVGNEPNLNLFWQPQFDSAGEDQAAVDYEALLAAA